MKAEFSEAKANRIKFAFVQSVPIEQIGLELLSACLKRQGIETKVFISHMHSPQGLIKRIMAFSPNFIGFSVCTADHDNLYELAEKLKAELPSVPIIWGGPHATFFPEIVELPAIDVVIRGEGEESLTEIVTKWGDTHIQGAWFKCADGEIIKNPVRRLTVNLDDLPYPDWNIYRESYPSLPYSGEGLVAGRGCPYTCAFCYNDALKKIFAADVKEGKYVRTRSPENVISEILAYSEKYGRPKVVKFFDDTFLSNKSWLFEFFALYNEKVKLPFTCLGRANQVTEEVIALLKKSGCSMVFWAIETGSQSIRDSILNKKVSDQHIRNCAALLAKYDIASRPYNMFCLPTETYEDAWSTVLINREIGNKYPVGTVYEPYPGTSMNDFILSCQDISLKKLDSAHKTQYAGAWIDCDPRIERVQKLFFYLVRFPPP